MKYKLSNRTITILEHIIFVAEKSAKVVQFCFRKGVKQYYITPKKDLLVSFNLDKKINFDYPIANLKTFLARAVEEVDSEKLIADVNKLILPNKDNIKEFEKKKVVQTLNFTLNDLKTTNSLHKFKYLNIMGVNKKCVFRYQNHIWNWWFDDGNKKIIPRGKCNRKFRYVLERNKIKLLPNNYKLICRDEVLQFQFKHLNYYFLPETSWLRQSVKDWVVANTQVTDRHLIDLYKSKGYIQQVRI